MTLIDSTTRQEVKAGDEVTTFRGEKGVLISWTPRRVYVKTDDFSYQNEWFLSVINCEVAG